MFRTDQNLISTVVTSPIHANIWSNRGIQFLSCTFENTTPISETNLSRGRGIVANNSNFTVDGPLSTVPSQFNQLHTGINTIASNSGLNYRVERTQFNNNLRGINSEGEMRPIISRNNFVVYNTVGFQNPLSETYGVHLRGCNGYQVNKNHFTSTTPAEKDVQVFGCIIDNSGPFPNVVEENIFVGLHTGGVSRRQNAAYFGQKPGGLRWLCNTFNNDRVNDLWVQSGANINPIQAILAGANIHTAGNRFYTINNPDIHIRMESNVPAIWYFHHNLDPNPLSATSNVNSSTLFSDKICGRVVIPTNQHPAFNLSDTLFGMRNELYEEVNALNQTIDYGNMDSLMLEIMDYYLTPQQKRSLLTQQSITISSDVLIRYMTTNPNHQDLYQVLVYNSPLKDVVIAYMMENTSLPSGMKQQILLLQEGVSTYESKQQIIQDILVNIDFLEQTLLETLLADTTVLNPYEQFLQVYEQTPLRSYSVQENLFNLYLATHNQQKADSMNTLLKALLDDPNYAYLNDLAVMSLQTDYAVLLQDSSIVEMLEIIADQHDYRDAMRAQALLSGYLGYEFEPIAVMGPKNKLVPKYTYDGSALETVSVFPNPAQDHFFIVFPDGYRDENADVRETREVKVYNLSGVEQLSREMNANDYVLEIKTENLAKGMYLVVISANGKEISTQKVAVR